MSILSDNFLNLLVAICALDKEVGGLFMGGILVKTSNSERFVVFEQQEPNEWENERNDKQCCLDDVEL